LSSKYGRQISVEFRFDPAIIFIFSISDGHCLARLQIIVTSQKATLYDRKQSFLRLFDSISRILAEARSNQIAQMSAFLEKSTEAELLH
jgi:hypothetical protein